MKPISKGRQSLYLDIYPKVRLSDNRLVRYYFLKIFIYTNPGTSLERQHNKETIELARHVCAITQLDVQNSRFGFLSERQQAANFIDFFEELSLQKKGSDQTIWSNANKYFKAFAGPFISFKEVDIAICDKFAAFLKSGPALGRHRRKIGRNTAAIYFRKFRRALKEAYKQKLLPDDVASSISAIKEIETYREFLFQDELQQLADTPCQSLLLKKVSLLSAITGLRFSDIQALRWPAIRGFKRSYYLQFRQEKTEDVEMLPISDIVIKLIGKIQLTDELIFPGLTYHLVTNGLKNWLRAAGIKKHITFHCFRHTFATLQLAAGTDIYTVSKMLGHRRLESTFRYVKIIDKLKRDAANRVRLKIARLKLPRHELTV